MTLFPITEIISKTYSFRANRGPIREAPHHSPRIQPLQPLYRTQQRAALLCFLSITYQPEWTDDSLDEQSILISQHLIFNRNDQRKKTT